MDPFITDGAKGCLLFVSCPAGHDTDSTIKLLNLKGWVNFGAQTGGDPPWQRTSDCAAALINRHNVVLGQAGSSREERIVWGIVAKICEVDMFGIELRTPEEPDSPAHIGNQSSLKESEGKLPLEGCVGASASNSKQSAPSTTSRFDHLSLEEGFDKILQPTTPEELREFILSLTGGQKSKERSIKRTSSRWDTDAFERRTIAPLYTGPSRSEMRQNARTHRPVTHSIKSPRRRPQKGATMPSQQLLDTLALLQQHGF